MKFTCTVHINRPIDAVVNLWKDESHFKEWQLGFESKELISGEKETKGAKSKIVLSHSGRSMELIETIEFNELPKARKIYVEHKHMCNYLTDSFNEVNSNETIYATEVEYTKFIGLIPNIMARLFPSMFKKQVQKWLDAFKVFAEANIPKP